MFTFECVTFSCKNNQAYISRLFPFMKSSKQIILACICAVFCSTSMAQSLTPQAVNSAGASMAQSNGSLHFTVGELVIETMTDAESNSLGSGFSNAAVGSTAIVSVEQSRDELWAVSLYPNPTSDRITLDWSRDLSGDVRMTLVDLQGRHLMSRTYLGASKNQTFDTSALAPGTYLLQLYHADTDAHATVKFIKTRH